MGMACELCGKDTSTVRALVEDVEMNVCKSCSGFGKVLKAPAVVQPRKSAPKLPEKIQMIVPGIGALVKTGREKQELTQKDFALKINEHQSTIHKVETGHLEPGITLARKLEKSLGISLIEEHEETGFSAPKTKSASLTVGDLIKLKGE